jgi:tRNA-splicing ligase RtcB (3'-phosphate/5'-hydroxy nucleic acid ligase)
MRFIGDIPVCGEVDQGAIDQIVSVRPTVEYAALLADGHQGYTVPIGGVVASQELISLAGVGYDVCCGNKAVRLDVDAPRVQKDISRIMDEIATQISFGVGRVSGWEVDHPLFHLPLWNEIEALKQRDARGHELRLLARDQLGTVGGGNHYCIVTLDELGRVWLAVHFGSRGFGHRIATWFLEAAGVDRRPEEHVQLHHRSDLGEQYLQCFDLASQYAYAGRDAVIERMVRIVGGDVVDTVHVNHNGIWRERHHGIEYFVARKGATPAWPRQRCFVGGSMGDDSVILEGVDGDLSRTLFYSTVHGAGRVMSRTQATGRTRYGKRRREPGITRQAMDRWVQARGVELRGADVDEAPQAYKRLDEVLPHQGDTIRVLHRLRPIGVAMAPSDCHDPYKD